ncbi:MAG: hypothetical protein GQ570_14400 [Helicobacteraceae bacterium]|nr:hypothetical protein [Helicobacteraceae bacterium]
MLKYLIAIFISSILTIEAMPIKDFNKYSIEEINKFWAKQINKKCPIRNDKVTRQLSWVAHGKIVTVKKEIDMYELSAYGAEIKLKNYMYPMDKSMACTNKLWSKVIRRGTIVKFKYIDTNNKFLFNIFIDKKDCK